MTKKRAFISFDYDHDEDLRNLLAGQAKHPDSPFDFADWSVKEHLRGDWKDKVRTKIRSTDVVIVLCGYYTDRAVGVGIELGFAKEERVPYFLLKGRSEGACARPSGVTATGKMYNWTWDNLKALIGGAR